MPAPSSGPCTPSQRHLDALATNGGEKCGLGAQNPIHSSGCLQQTLDCFPDLSKLHQADPERYPFLLESVLHGPQTARYDILFAFPGEDLVLAGGQLKRAGTLCHGGFLDQFASIWQQQAVAFDASENAAVDLPFQGGWFVFLSYELVTETEPTLIGIPEDNAQPVAMATRIPAAVIRDHQQLKTHLVCEAAEGIGCLAQLRHDLFATPEPKSPPVLQLAALNEEDPERYRIAVRRAKEYIREGDVFQVNLSRLWRTELNYKLAPVALYRRLRYTNPAPFAGLIHFGNRRAVVSSSPERLVSVHRGQVRTRPIAGTYPRSSDPRQDRAWSEELLLHPKEKAEHIMLIDLERNDLGRVCRTGTVKVAELMNLESYRHVHHIVSEVTGELRADVSPVDIIRAVFPGGTITGCPKVRCMEIIHELEGAARGAYTGSMGYVNHDGSMDLNILIRTFVQDGDRLSLRAGAGIVADSVPERELNETRAKAEGLLQALRET